MHHSDGIFPCSQDGDLAEEQIIARAYNNCLWTVPVLTVRERYFWETAAEHFKVVPKENTHKGFARQVCSEQSLPGSQAKEMRQIVCDN